MGLVLYYFTKIQGQTKVFFSHIGKKKVVEKERQIIATIRELWYIFCCWLLLRNNVRIRYGKGGLNGLWLA